MKAKSRTDQGKTKAVPFKTRSLTVKLTPEQYALIEDRSESQGLRVSVWVRSILLQAATSPRNGRFLRIHEPNGAKI
jgi:hypothetical protein